MIKRIATTVVVLFLGGALGYWLGLSDKTPFDPEPAISTYVIAAGTHVPITLLTPLSCKSMPGDPVLFMVRGVLSPQGTVWISEDEIAKGTVKSASCECGRTSASSSIRVAMEYVVDGDPVDIPLAADVKDAIEFRESLFAIPRPSAQVQAAWQDQRWRPLLSLLAKRIAEGKREVRLDDPRVGKRLHQLCQVLHLPSLEAYFDFEIEDASASSDIERLIHAIEFGDQVGLRNVSHGAPLIPALRELWQLAETVSIYFGHKQEPSHLRIAPGAPATATVESDTTLHWYPHG